jgi:hypothetical protein
MDQVGITIEEDSSLGRQILAALEQVEHLAWNRNLLKRQYSLFNTDVSRDALITAFYAAREQPRTRQIGGIRLNFGGPSFSQTGDDLQEALGSTQAILIGRDHGQLHVLCSDDRDAFGDAMLRPWELTELPKKFATTGRFHRTIVNAIA